MASGVSGSNPRQLLWRYLTTNLRALYLLLDMDQSSGTMRAALVEAAERSTPINNHFHQLFAGVRALTQRMRVCPLHRWSRSG
jgi:hypothetical protein